MKRLAIFLLLSLILVVLAGCNQLPLTGSLSGTVMTAANKPLSAVCLTIGGKTVYTDSTGHYSISGLAAGSYILSASKEGYEEFSQNVYLSNGENETLNITLELVTSPTTGTLKGYVTDGRGGPALSGAEVTFAGMSVLTDVSGYFEMQVPGDTPGDVLIQKAGRASSKLQNFEVVPGGSAYFEVPNRPSFNPAKSLVPPTVYVNGIQLGATASGMITFTVQVLGANAAGVFFVYMGGEQLYPVESQGIQIDTNNVTINTAYYPNGSCYIKVLAYDANENATILLVPLTIQNTVNDSTVPAGVSHVTAYSVTYGQNLQEYRESRDQFFAQYHILADSNLLHLPSGRELDLDSFAVNGTIGIQLLWEQLSGADGYSVYRSFDGTTFSKIGVVHHVVNTEEYGPAGYYEDFSAQLAPGKKTYYQIVPYNSYGEAQSPAAIDITPLPPLNVLLQTPANNATNVSLSPTFIWAATSNNLSFPFQTMFSYSFALFEATNYLVWETTVTSANNCTVPWTLTPNTVYSWDIYAGVAEVLYRDDSTGFASAVSIAGNGYGSANGEFIFTTVQE